MKSPCIDDFPIISPVYPHLHPEKNTIFKMVKSHYIPIYPYLSLYIPTGWGPSSLAKLVYNTTIVYDTQITIFGWGYQPTYNWRGHPVCIYVFFP